MLSEERIKEIAIKCISTWSTDFATLADEIAESIKQALEEERELREQDVVETLEWYEEQTRLARLVHSGGDGARWALSTDGGTKARNALETIKKEQA